MSVSNVRKNLSYGLSDPLLNVFPSPIVSQRAPAGTDKAPIGQIWIDQPNDDGYLLTSIVNNVASWIGIGGGSGIFTSITVTPGNITVTNGNIIVSLGTISAGSTITAGAGVTATNGDIVASTGNISATLGSVSAGTTVTAGTGITSTTGDIEAVAGNVVMPNSNAALTQGVLILGATPFVHNFGSGNTFIGGSGNGTLDIVSATNNTAIGNGALVAVDEGSENVALGQGAAAAIEDGVENIAIGAQSLSVLTDGDSNTVLGFQALNLMTLGDRNIAIGYQAGTAYTTTESSNIVIGNVGVIAEDNVIRIGTDGTGAGQQDECFIAGNVNVSRNLVLPATSLTAGAVVIDGVSVLQTFGTDNTFVGQSSGNVTTTGISNVALGSGNMAVLTNGNNNVAVGAATLPDVTSGSNNIAIGSAALNVLDDGRGNIAIGSAALVALDEGVNNIVIGNSSGSSYTTNESDNIIIGNSIAGVALETNVTRIGEVQTATFIGGIFGVTTGLGDAVPVVVDSAGQLGTVVSSRKFKEEIRDMGDESSDILKLRPVIFRYKQPKNQSKQFGLIAEEVAEIMPDLVVYDLEGEPHMVKYHDMPALLLNELQKQVKKVEELTARIEQLEKK